MKFYSILRSPTTKFHSILGPPTTKFHSILGSPTTKFHSILGSPTTKFHSILGPPTTKFQFNLRSPTTALETSWGVRQSRSLSKSFSPQSEEHWGSLQKLRSITLLYIVHCTLNTVHCTLYTVHCTMYNVQFSHIKKKRKKRKKKPNFVVSYEQNYCVRVGNPFLSSWNHIESIFMLLSLEYIGFIVFFVLSKILLYQSGTINSMLKHKSTMIKKSPIVQESPIIQESS